MNGILLSNLRIGDVSEKQRIEFSDFVLCESMIDKFREDKLFVENSGYICAIDGVILNKKELCEQKNVSSMQELVDLYLKEGMIDFFKDFRGTYNGIVYIKSSNQLWAFVDQYASKPLFYYYDNDRLIISSALKDLTDVLDNNGLKCSINNEAIGDLISYSFVLCNETILKEVNRVPAGCFLSFYLEEEKIRKELTRYHQFTQQSEISVSEEEAIEEIDRLFRKAVALEYEKDKEYGYKHIATLSAGLDARMNNWVANELGYKDILNCTFAQVGSLDMTTPAEVAERLNHQWLFKSLNDAACMTAWQKMSPLTNGLCSYWNVAHEYLMFELIDMNKFGLYHTGMLGDVLIGSHFAEKKKYTGGFIGGNSSLYSKEDKLREDNTLQGETEELYNWYGRLLQGTNAGSIPEYTETEVVSPFLYLELAEYCMSLPQELRYNHKIYLKWVLKKYPEAADYSWNGIDIKEWDKNNGVIPTTPKKKKKKYLKKFVKEIKKGGLGRAFNQTLYKLGIKTQENAEAKKNVRVSKPIMWGMNPVDYWYENKPLIKSGMDDYFSLGLKKYSSSGIPLEKMEYIYNNGLAQDKAMCITVFASLDEFAYVIGA